MESWQSAPQGTGSCGLHLHSKRRVLCQRAKSNTQFQRRYSHPVDKYTGLRPDQTIVLTGATSATDYPAPLRRIHYFDAEHRNDFVFLTNNPALPALTIARLYKARWRVELFFRYPRWTRPARISVRARSYASGTTTTVASWRWCDGKGVSNDKCGNRWESPFRYDIISLCVSGVPREENANNMLALRRHP
jgi:hypothetical protein